VTQARFDGFEVNVYEGKLTGGFELDELQAAKLNLDRIAVFVVAARLGKAQVEAMKDGDVKRTNTFVVSELQILEGELRDQAIQYLAMPNQGILEFDLDDEDDDVELDELAAEAVPVP
jgi:hypothetical protein